MRRVQLRGVHEIFLSLPGSTFALWANVFSCYELSQDRVSLMAGKKSDDIWLFSGCGKEMFAA